jgi:hypothetical protein
MKRTTTEVFIEIEEIVAVRQTEKSERLIEEETVCPFCGQTLNEIKEIKEGDIKK